jgi:hypothetical protein
VRALESVGNEHKEKEQKLKDQVARAQRVVAASRQSVDRARRQAELEAPLNDALKRRLADLPDDM